MAMIVAVILIFSNLYISKYLKEAICLKVAGKPEFNNLDADLVTRIVIFLGLFAIEVSIFMLL